MRRFFVALAMIALVLAPLGAGANDRQIAEQIVRGLKQRQDAGDLQGFNIDLQVDKGAVWLKGHVSNPDQERIALKIAQRVEGVQKVFNEIEIRGSAAEQVAQTESRSAGSDDAAMSVNPVSTRRSRRVQPAVVDEPTDRTELEENTTQLASSTADETEKDREEAQRIAKELVTKLRAEQQQGNLQKFGIDIEVENGTLWLKGQMASHEQRHLVLEIARRVRGVKQVVNDLVVIEAETEEVILAKEPETTPFELASQENLTPKLEEVTPELEQSAPAQLQPSPSSEIELSETQTAQAEALAQEIISRLQTQKEHGALRDFGVDVSVDQGVVWMSGYVASKAQQSLALDIARYVPGVKQVVNDLSITQREEIHTTAEYEETLASHPSPIELPNQEPAALPQTARAQTEANPLRNARPPATAPQIQQAQQLQSVPQLQAGPQIPGAIAFVPSQGQGNVIGHALVPIGGNSAPAPRIANQPLAFAPARPVTHLQQLQGQPQPMMGASGVGVAPARYDHPQLPGYAWPSYAAHPNYGAVTYPRQYSAQAWPYIGPFYPYPQVPLGWRKVTLEWDDGWWQLDFKDRH